MRKLRVLLPVGLLLVAGLLVAADRVVAHIVAGRLAARLQCAAELDAKPSVAIGGIVPASYQALTRTLRSVRVTAHGPPPFTTVEVTARDVRQSADGLRVGALDAAVTVPYAAIPASGLSGLRAADGLVVADTTRRGLPVTVYATPSLADGALTLTPVEVEVLGMRTGAPGGSAVSRPLPALPSGLAYRSVAAGDDGLIITVAGSLTAAAGSGAASLSTCPGGTA